MASPYFNMQVAATVIETLGLLLTTWRIYFRLRIARFWWEDACAAILLTIGLSWVISFWIYLFVADELASIVSSWFINIGSTSIVTLSRLSILFSIIRIIHRRPRLLVFSYACVVFFVVCWGTLVAGKASQCATDPSWHRGFASPQKSFCLVDKDMFIFEFTTTCISILILVVLPLRMLWRVRLPTRQRRMILSIFASSIVLAFGAVFQAVGQILNIITVMVAGFHTETALSIIVCNLLVVVTYTYHFLQHRTSETTNTAEQSLGSANDDDFTTRCSTSVASASAFPLTTVDVGLEVPLASSTEMAENKSLNFIS